MKRILLIGTLLAAALPGLASAQPMDSIQQQFDRVAADYKRVASNGNVFAKVAAGKLARRSYRLIIEQAPAVGMLDETDLHALGLCYETLGDLKQAHELYDKALAKKETARTRFSLARATLVTDLAASERHYAAAVKLAPQHPGVGKFPLFLAAAHRRKGQFPQAIAHLQKYLDYSAARLKKTPDDSRQKRTHVQAERQLDSLRILQGLLGKPAPALQAKMWVQGQPIRLEQLRGKVVLLDFCFVWSPKSRQRLKGLQQLAQKYKDQPLQVLAVTRLTGAEWQPDKKSVRFSKKTTAEQERANIVASAKKLQVTFPIGEIAASISGQYGVTAIPHSVLIGRDGKVQRILLDALRAEDQLDPPLRAALGLKE